MKTGIFAILLRSGLRRMRLPHCGYRQCVTVPSWVWSTLLNLTVVVIVTACGGNSVEYSSFIPVHGSAPHSPWLGTLKLTTSLPGASVAASRSNRQSAPGDPPQARYTQTRRAKLTVLYIEDNPLELAATRQLFAKATHLTLLNSRTGEYGIKLAITHSPALILLDLTLPGINGTEVLRRLRSDAATRTIPVVAITRNANALGMPLDLVGFDDYLTKPVNAARLQAILNRFILVDPDTTLRSQAD